MSETQANQNQNTPSADALEAQIAADEAARNQPEPTETTVDPEAEAESEPKAEPEPEAKEEKSDDEQSEFEKRLARLAFKEREARNRARALEEEVARLRGQAPPLSPDDATEKLVQERAAALAAQQVFNDKANAVHRQGLETFPDFQQRLNELHAAGVNLTNPMVEAAIDVGDAHKVIHYLARNIDEAETIVALPPARMGAALAKIAAKIAATPVRSVSKAPPPIKPLGGKGRAEPNEDTMPISEYMAREDERARNRGGRRY